MKNFDNVFIKNQYYIDNPKLKEIMDKGTTRNYLYLYVTINNNNIFIPLRSDITIKDTKNKLKDVVYPLPCNDMPKAGLDYRKILIINDFKYLEIPKKKIKSSQLSKINANKAEIEKQVIKYIQGYIKAVNKGRNIMLEPKYMYSTLQNYNKELGI